VMEFPPGYMNAFKYALAVMLAPSFGAKIREYPDVVAIADRSLGNIKRANAKNKQRVMRSDSMYSDEGSGWQADWRQGF